MNSKQMQARNDRYAKYVDSVTARTNTAKSLFHAFVFGGFTCVIGQGLIELYAFLLPSYAMESIANLASITLIVVAILLTGIGVYDKLARVGGAGSFVPITGFANAMSSASMEFKSEGLIFGTSVKFFSVVGPVIVNGIVWSALAGIAHLLIFGRI